MKIGFYLSDKGISGKNISTPENGNPGIGGTEYCFSFVIRYLLLNFDDMEIYVFHYEKNVVLPNNAISILIDNEESLFEKIKSNDIDIFVHNTNKSKKWYNLINKYKINTIVWAHCYIDSQEIKFINHNNFVKRVVFVGKEQYDYYYDNDIILKSTYIYNMVNTKKINVCKKNIRQNNVTYIGSLTFGKGFHILAKIWPEVLKDVPNAQLIVLGSGKLYDNNTKLGKYNLAEEQYEKLFLSNLLDDTGKIIPSVHFMGVVEDKDLILKNTKVGIVNPTANTETFCLSAVEMEGYGIPIISKRKHGLLDTIIHKKTGLLFINKKYFKNYIVKLLTDDKYNFALGEQAKKFVDNSFDPEILIGQWRSLFTSVFNNENAYILKVTNHYFNDLKFLKLFIHFLRFKCKCKFIPSIEDLKYILKMKGEK